MAPDDGPLAPALLDAQATALTSPALQLDLENYSRKIVQTGHSLEDIRHTADGLFLWGRVGWDGLIGLLPVVGAFYSAYKGVALLRAANDLRASVGLKLYVWCMMLIDILVGIVVGGGDVIDLLFRSHAMVARRLLDEADRQLHLCEVTRQRLAGVPQDQVADHPAVIELRDQLFRAGRTEAQHKQRAMIIGGVVLALIVLALVTG